MRSLFFQVSNVFNRVALMEDDRLLWADGWSPTAVDPTHQLFWSRVHKVVAGTQAAFVELAKGRMGFLSRRDLPPGDGMSAKTPIEAQLKAGTHLPIQVKKPVVEHKQWPVTAELRFVGFFLIFLPADRRLSFSRDFDGDREHVSAAVKAWQSESGSGGWIVRSAASHAPAELLEREARRLSAQYQHLQKNFQGKVRRLYKPDPWMALLYQHAKGGFRSIVVDDEVLFHQLQDRLQDEYPALLAALRYHPEPTGLFETYRIQSQLERALTSKLWLPSGGYLHFRDTEAGITVDVNSGKQGKGRAGVGVALRTNLEAAEALGRQIPLRNLTGLIFVDFIDLPKEGDRKRVEQAVKQALKSDGVRTDFLPINRWGIAMIRRQRIGIGLQQVFQVSCGACRGSGRRLRWEVVGLRLERLLSGGPEALGEAKVTLHCHPHFAEYLRSHGARWLEPLIREHGFELTIAEMPEYDYEQFEWSLQNQD